MERVTGHGGAETDTSLLFVMRVPDDVLARLQTAFPTVRFAVAEPTPPDAAGHFIPDLDPAEDALAAAEAVVGWEFSAEQLAAAPSLRWLHAASAGVDHFDLAALAARGVTVTNSRGVHAISIAEHVLGMMIALTRRFPRLIQAQAARDWRDWETHREVGELQGQSVLLVGLGEIGQEVARRASAFGMPVHGVRRHPGKEPPMGISRVYPLDALDEALPEADHVVLMLPDTPATRGLFDEARIAKMKPGAVIYNVGRGMAIDTAALTAALAAGTLGGAGLDVTDPEPLPRESPLWTMDNVLITSHTAGATPRYWERLEPLLAENIARWLRGDALRNLVDLEAGY